jgi:hypothetical protein
MDNQERMDELMDRIHAHHQLHGYGVNLRGWTCVRKQMYQPFIDGSLVAIELVTTVDFFPDGSFQCGVCEETCCMTRDMPCYFDYNFQFIVCSTCNAVMKPRAIPSFPRMCVRVFGDVDINDHDHTSMIDMCKNENRMKHGRNIALKQAKRIADGSNMCFFDGKTTKDIWNDILAKRVIRHMKKNVATNLRKKVAYVLYHKLHIDPNTATLLANQHL